MTRTKQGRGRRPQNAVLGIFSGAGIGAGFFLLVLLMIANGISSGSLNVKYALWAAELAAAAGAAVGECIASGVGNCRSTLAGALTGGVQFLLILLIDSMMQHESVLSTAAIQTLVCCVCGGIAGSVLARRIVRLGKTKKKKANRRSAIFAPRSESGKNAR